MSYLSWIRKDFEARLLAHLIIRIVPCGISFPRLLLLHPSSFFFLFHSLEVVIQDSIHELEGFKGSQRRVFLEPKQDGAEDISRLQIKKRRRVRKKERKKEWWGVYSNLSINRAPEKDVDKEEKSNVDKDEPLTLHRSMYHSLLPDLTPEISLWRIFSTIPFAYMYTSIHVKNLHVCYSTFHEPFVQQICSELRVAEKASWWAIPHCPGMQ